MLHTLTYNATMAPRCKKKSFGVVFGFCTTDSICIIVYYTVVAPELHHSIVRVNPYKIRRSNCKKSDFGASIPYRSNLFHPKRLTQSNEGSQPRRCDPPKRDRYLPEKLPLHSGFCARPIFSFKKEKSVFLGCPALWCRVAGVAAFFFAPRVEKRGCCFFFTSRKNS